MLHLDHFAVAAETLREGVSVVEETLGVRLAPGGEHALMGTHNRLLSLGPGLYLEVIAADPAAIRPDRPRWFDLDRFTGPPSVTNWVARCDGIEAEIARSPAGAGRIHNMARGDFRWRISIPDDGRLPFDGGFPGLIDWQGSQHPSERLPDAGCRLRRLTITHPEATALSAALAGRIADPRLTVETGTAVGFLVEIDTPNGLRVLG